MAIGVFDSGIGGLTVHRKLVDRLPDTNLIYLADQANTPYGGKDGEAIVDLTRAGCERLFSAGCDLVVLACNTASAIALRRLQQTWLPGYRRDLGRPVNVLGIIVPTIEAATGMPWEHEAERRGDKVEKLDILAVFSTPATARSRVYEIVADMFRAALPPGTPLIHQPQATADALVDYLDKHPHYDVGSEGRRLFLTTGKPGVQHILAETFWGGPLSFEQA